MTKTNYKEAGLTLAQVENIISESVWSAADYSTSTSAQQLKTDQALTAAAHAAETWDGVPWWWQRETATWQTSTKTVATVANSGAARASNVVTITTTAVHGLAVGQFVKITDVSDSTFDGTFEVATVPSTTTLTYAQVGDAVGATTAGTGSLYVVSYPLREIAVTGAVVADSEVMLDLWGIEEIYYDNDWPLQQISWREYRRHLVILSPTGSSIPYEYALHGRKHASLSGSRPFIYLWPPPADAYNISVDYIKRHTKVTGGADGSNDMELIVPSEYQWGIYINGAEWLLRHEITDMASIRECPGFMEAINRMRASDPTLYDKGRTSDKFPDAVGYLPHDRRIIWWADGGRMIQNTVSI